MSATSGAGTGPRGEPEASTKSLRSNVRVECRDEDVLNGIPAVVYVFDGDTVVERIVASTVPQKGADSGVYPAVQLAKA